MQQLRVAVAVSGGRDSTALLHCTLQQARPLGLQVLALHVHHGLMPQADEWQQQVQRQSRRWGASFDSRRLQGAPGKGDSIEAWAREGRYRALTEMAQAHECSLVLLAHHQLDQAETYLLQALRGAGVAGQAAMPAQRLRQGIQWARPWLNMGVQAIEAYVRRHRLRFVDDPSNNDPTFLRSRLRQQVWPTLLTGFPDADTTLAAAARHAQDALALAQEAAEADLSVLQQGEGLLCPAWLQLPSARRLNALRAWLTATGGSPPPQSLLDRLLHQLPGATQGSWPVPGGKLRLYRGVLLRLGAEVDAPAGSPLHLDLSRPGRVPVLEWRGHWQVQPSRSLGIRADDLRQLVARARHGGELFSLRPGAPARSLKKQFQASGVPAWQRHGPLLTTHDDRLMLVPGLGPEAAFQAPPGSPQLRVDWVPDAPVPTGRRQRAR
ncbi:MAG: tRNA lysidine(34) synthetase TilS [Rubrivivax sp.]|nr:tRNA lysidine(34) synthetase TilS [Rubrivivax sp.]